MTKFAVIFTWVLFLVGSGVVQAVPLRSQPEIIFGTDFLRIKDDPEASHDLIKTSRVRARTLEVQPEPTHLEEGPFPGLEQTKILLEDLQRRPRNFRLSSRHLGKLDPHSTISLPSLSSSSVSPPTTGATQHQGSVRQSSTSRRTPQGLEAAVNPIKSTRKFTSPPTPSGRSASLSDQQGEGSTLGSPSDVFPLTQDDYDYNYYNYYLDDLYDEIPVQDSGFNLTEQKVEVTSQSPVTPSIPSILSSTPAQIKQDIPVLPTQLNTTSTSLPPTESEVSNYPMTTERSKVNNSAIPQKRISDDQSSQGKTQTSSLILRNSKETETSRTDTRAPFQLRASSSRAQPPLSLTRGRKILPVTVKAPSLPDDTTKRSLVDPVLPKLQQSVTTESPQIQSQITTTESIRHANQSLPQANQENKSKNGSQARKQQSSTDTQYNDQTLTSSPKSRSTTTHFLSKSRPAVTRTGDARIKGSHKFVPRQYTGPRIFRYTTPASKSKEQERGSGLKNSLRETLGSTSSSVAVEAKVQVPKTGPDNEISQSSLSSMSPSSTTVPSISKSSTTSTLLSTTVSPSSTPQLLTLSPSTSNPLLSSSASGSRMAVPHIKSSSDHLKNSVNDTKPEQMDENIEENQPTERSVLTEVTDTKTGQKDKNPKETPHLGRRVQAEKSEHQTTSFLLSDPLVVDLTSAASTTTTTTRRHRIFRPDPLLAAPQHRARATVTSQPLKPTTTTASAPTTSKTTSATTTTAHSATNIATTIIPTDIITTFPPSTTSTSASTSIVPNTTPSKTTSTSNPSKSSTTSAPQNFRENHAMDRTTGETARSKSVHSSTGSTSDQHTTSVTTQSTPMSTTSTAGTELTEVEGLSQGVVEELQVRRGQSRGLEFQTSVVEVMGTVASESPTASVLQTASATVPDSSSQTTPSKHQESLSHPNTSTEAASQTSGLSQQIPGDAAQPLPTVGSSLAQQGVAPHGLSPFGEAPEGLTPFGYAPEGLAPQGIVPKGLHPHGLSPKGNSPMGDSSAGLTLVDATVGAGRADANSTVGYVVEEHNLSRFRLEEKTPDGFIIGEYGVVDHTTGDVNGVRYTADSTADPRLIYESLMKFLEL